MKMIFDEYSHFEDSRSQQAARDYGLFQGQRRITLDQLQHQQRPVYPRSGIIYTEGQE